MASAAQPVETGGGWENTLTPSAPDGRENVCFIRITKATAAAAETDTEYAYNVPAGPAASDGRARR